MDTLNRINLNSERKAVLIDGSSFALSTRKRVRTFFFNAVDLLYIDAGHTYGAVKSDWQMYSRLVREGGVVVFHDIYGQAYDVGTFWNEIKDDYRHIEIGRKQGEGRLGIGVLYK